MNINIIIGILAMIFLMVILLCILASRVANLEGKVWGLLAIAHNHHNKIDELLGMKNGGDDNVDSGDTDKSEE